MGAVSANAESSRSVDMMSMMRRSTVADDDWKTADQRVINKSWFETEAECIASEHA